MMRGHINCLVLLSLLVASSSLITPSIHSANIAIIIDEDSQGNRPPNPEDSDPALVAHLQSQGHVITLFGDEEADPVDLTGQDLLIISSTVSSGNILSAYRDIDIPILFTEYAISDDMNLSGGGGDQSAGTVEAEIVNNTHFITQGLPMDFVQFQTFDTNDELVYIAPSGGNQNAPGLVTLAVTLENVDRIFLAAIDRGGRLNNGLPSVNRRVFYGIPNFGFDYMTDEAWQVFDRSVEWLLSTPVADFSISRSVAPNVISAEQGSALVTLILNVDAGKSVNPTIVETPPTGWTVSELTSSAGTANQAGGNITWTLTNASGVQTLRYRVTPSAGTNRGTFEAVAQANGGEFPVTGDRQIRVSQGGKNLIFIESGGLVVMEAENFYHSIPDAIDPNYRWVLGSSGNIQSDPGISFGTAGTDFSGDFVHGNQIPRTDRGVPNDDFLAELGYKIEFTTGGTYYLWIRELDAAGGSSNTSYTNLGSRERPDALRIGSGNNFWEWDEGKDAAIVSYQVTPGVRQFYVWLGETGIALDKIILTTDPNYFPSDLGPPESATRVETPVNNWSLY